MPSPLAHPAASIPFTKVGLVFSALVIGSIAPDCGYFFNLPGAYFMYTPLGIVTFDVPMGLLLLWLFHVIAKWPLLSLLPRDWQRRLYKHAQGFTWGPIKHFGVILLSLLVGSITHVILDSFTHEYGWTVERFSFLSTSIGGIPLYDILQNLGSLVGIGLLVYWFIRWLPKQPQGDQLPPRFSFKITALFAGLALLSIALVDGGIFYARYLARTADAHLRMLSFRGLVFSTGFLVLFFAGIYCLVWMISFYKTLRGANG
jgi:hypothetical protein